MRFDVKVQGVHNRHSRSEAAGYSMEVVERAHVVVAGAGALGQNVLLNLALSGIGTISVIDFDHFEDHNVTRSPLYPSPAQLAKTVGLKAPGVSLRLAPLMTANEPTVTAYIDPVQSVPRQVFASAHVVLSAVDRNSARLWLGKWCRLLGVPLVEAGFEGPAFNVSAFSADPSAGCLGCLLPEGESSASCTQRARLLAGTGIVPALQSTAATLAGYVTELAIEILHKRYKRVGYLTRGNLRTHDQRTATITAVADCDVGHKVGARIVAESLPSSWRDVASLVGAHNLLLSAPVVRSAQCPACVRWCRPNVPDHEWIAQPFCDQCVDGGRTDAGSYPALDIVAMVAGAEIENRLADLDIVHAGVMPGGMIATVDDAGAVLLYELPGQAASALSLRGGTTQA